MRSDEPMPQLQHLAHYLLAKWQALWGVERVKLLTQNVDDLLERAGAQQVTHLHGDLSHLLCTACGTRWPVLTEEYNKHTRCIKCNSLKGVKPGVVFFGEQAPEYRALGQLHRARSEDILLVIGTSFEVIDPSRLMKKWRWGHELNWQVNPALTQKTCFGLNLEKKALEGLLELEPRLELLMNKGDIMPHGQVQS